MLTVLLATRNRSEILRGTLEAFCGLQEPASGWKMVVVDNGSADRTAEVIASFGNRLPIHAVSEPRLGKNNALNAGLGLVEGDLTILTDDDVFPAADWLLQMRKAADEHLSYFIFGGVVAPRWQNPPPPWALLPEFGAAFGVSSPLAKEGPVATSLLSGTIIGPNMAIRTSVFEAGIRFDPSIGPCGPNYAMGSETEIILRLSRQGHKAWHVHDSVVEHLVRPEQMERASALDRAIRLGRGLQRQSPDKQWLGIPRYLFRDVPKQGFLMAVAWMTFRREALFRSLWYLNVLRGNAIEARVMARERRAAGDLRLEQGSSG